MVGHSSYAAIALQSPAAILAASASVAPSAASAGGVSSAFSHAAINPARGEALGRTHPQTLPRLRPEVLRFRSRAELGEVPLQLPDVPRYPVSRSVGHQGFRLRSVFGAQPNPLARRRHAGRNLVKVADDGRSNKTGKTPTKGARQSTT